MLRRIVRRLSLVLSIKIVLLFIESSSKERSQGLNGDSSQQLETELSKRLLSIPGKYSPLF